MADEKKAPERIRIGDDIQDLEPKRKEKVEESPYLEAEVKGGHPYIKLDPKGF